MSRLYEIGGGVKKRVMGDLKVPSSLGIVAFVIVMIVVLLIAILVVAGVYSLLASRTITLEAPPTTTSSTTSTTSTTSPPTTSTSTTSTSTTSSETSLTSTSSTSTTTTISREKILMCMQGRISEIYVNANPQSASLKAYLNENSLLFSATDCSLDEEKKACTDNMKAYIADDSLYLPNGKTTQSIGYPAIILSKDNTAHVIPSPAEFERLLDCGSLKKPLLTSP